MAKAYVMIGIAGSGKSSWAKKNAKILNAEVISSDDIRIELFGSLDQSDNTKVFYEFHKRAVAKLNEGQDVILDATNLNRKRRKHLTHNILKGHVVHYIVIATPIKDLLLRNVMRPHPKRLPHEALIRQIKNFEFPYVNLDDGVENEERFNNITVIRNEFKRPHIDDYMRFANGFEQFSPYHTEDVWSHTLTSLEYLSTLGVNLIYEDYVELALTYHDLGKPFSQTPHPNPKIEGHMRYIAHENVSTYIYLTIEKYNPWVTNLISGHIIMNTISDKNKQKMIDRIGLVCYTELEKLHKADKYRREV